MTWFRRIWLLMFCGIPLTILVFGAVEVWTQHYRILAYRPVPATVLSTEIATHENHGKHGTTYTYEPVVHYRFNVQGRNWEGKNVFPLTASAGRVWASSVVARFPAGLQVTAYHDPDEPSKSFLLPHLAFEPYIMVLFPMLFITVGVLVGCFLISGRAGVQPPRPLDTGEFQLQPAKSIRGRVLLASILAGMWWGVGLAGGGHYFLFADRPYDTAALMIAPIYAAIGLIPAGMLVYYLLVWREFVEPQVTTDTGVFTVGRPFTLLLEQRAREPMTIEAVEVSLVCKETTRTCSGGKTTYSTNTHYQAKQTLEVHQAVKAGDPISDLQPLVIPAGQPATSPRRPVRYPYYDWSIEIRVKVPKKPDYRGTFPIVVQAREGG